MISTPQHSLDNIHPYIVNSRVSDPHYFSCGSGSDTLVNISRVGTFVTAAYTFFFKREDCSKFSLVQKVVNSKNDALFFVNFPSL